MTRGNLLSTLIKEGTLTKLDGSRYRCVCGSTLQSTSVKRHVRTLRHTRHIESKVKLRIKRVECTICCNEKPVHSFFECSRCTQCHCNDCHRSIRGSPPRCPFCRLEFSPTSVEPSPIRPLPRSNGSSVPPTFAFPPILRPHRRSAGPQIQMQSVNPYEGVHRNGFISSRITEGTPSRGLNPSSQPETLYRLIRTVRETRYPSHFVETIHQEWNDWEEWPDWQGTL
jgi:hypothetical protein